MSVMDSATAVLSKVASHHPVHPHPVPELHEHITSFGHNVLWVTFIAFAITFVIFAVKTFQIKPAERANAYTSLFIVGIAGISYYAMATGLGVTEVAHAHAPHHYRQLFFARYIDWVFTTPLLLLELMLLSGLDLGTTIWMVGADVAMIVTGLFGTFEYGIFKWGWFFAGCAFMIVVVVGLWGGKQVAYRRNAEIGNLYSSLTVYLLVLWWAYPIVWAISEGMPKISSNTEVLCYAVLDVLAKIVFSIVIYNQHAVVASANQELTSRLDVPLLGAGATDEVL